MTKYFPFIGGAELLFQKLAEGLTTKGVESLIQVRKSGLPIKEASISCVYHEESHSANPVLHGLGVALMAVKHRFKLLN